MVRSERSPRQKVRPQSPESAPKIGKTAADSFPIVGVGASAGGLEAMERLLKHLPVRTGMAFLLVQHLDPKHESMLTDILSRTTSMAVAETKDGMRVEPNHVYIIPPNASMSLWDSTLRLEPRDDFKTHNLPVDTLFRSLATVQKNRAIGVILSGTASDGVAGMQAIKQEGGITFAQDEGSAKYFAMPQSSIVAGVVDFVLPPEEIAKRLAEIGRHPYVRAAWPVEAEEPPLSRERAEPLNHIFRLLQRRFGVDFSAYKFSTISRRIKRRMVLRAMGEFKDYLRYLRQNPEELRDLYQDMFIGVTSFFREPKAFESLKKLVFPQILKARSGESSIRIWVPGCATGEEAYSVAIALPEYVKDKASSIRIQIFGTDINEEAIRRARLGRYGQEIAPDVGKERLRRFFSKTELGYEVSKTVRDLCIFAKHDLISTPPFFHLDLVCCRNVLIYMGGSLQQKLLPVFHFTLKPTGFLMLGSAETVGGFADSWVPVDAKNKIYGKKKGSVVLPRFAFLANRLEQPAAIKLPPTIPVPRSDMELQKEASDRIVLNEYAPPSVLVNDELDILHFRGHTGPFLEPSPGIASLNLLKMAREGLLVGLQGALRTVRKKNTNTRVEGLRVGFNGSEKIVNIQVVPIRPPGAKECTFLILFDDVTEKSPPAAEKAGPRHARLEEHSSGERLTQLKQELAMTKAYLQSVIETQEAGNEELRSMNEEMLSSDEELQSTTEEMEITSEELQSSNEELSTLNEELSHRHAELNRAQSDILNLLNLMNVAILFLDRGLRIQRFTSTAREMLNLIPNDVGRSIRDIRLAVKIPDLEDRLQNAMDSVRTSEEMIQGPSGRWYSLQVRPYITVENKIDGAILSLTDVHELTQKDRELAKARKQFEVVVESAPDAMLLMDADGRRHCIVLGRTRRRELAQAIRACQDEMIGEGAPCRTGIVTTCGRSGLSGVLLIRPRRVCRSLAKSSEPFSNQTSGSNCSGISSGIEPEKTITGMKREPSTHHGHKLDSRHAGHLEVGDYDSGKFITELYQTFNPVLSFAGFEPLLF